MGDLETVKNMAVTKQLPAEQREKIAIALAPAIDELLRGNYTAPFDAVLTVELTDANGKRWTASVTTSGLASKTLTGQLST
jgi:hypothetical protein